MKKTTVILTILLCASLFFVGCGKKTVYDDKQIEKIEAIYNEGFAAFPGFYRRTFDFTAGNVIDERVCDESFIENEIARYLNVPEQFADYPTVETFRNYLNAYLNHPEIVISFTQEQGRVLLKKVRALGLFTWNDRYATNDIILDGESSDILLYFTDGTEKRTHFYFKYPKNYDKIVQAFQSELNVKLFFDSN